MTNTTWSTTDKSANITLSGSNLMASVGAGLSGGVRSLATLPIPTTGKVYFEITVTGINAFAQFGLANSTIPLGSGTGTIGTALVASGGSIYVDNSSTGYQLGAIPDGTVVGFAIDRTINGIWFRNASTSGPWNAALAGNPATGTGALTWNPTNMFAFASTLSSQGTSFLANFGDSSFVGALPSGFTSFLGPYRQTQSGGAQIAGSVRPIQLHHQPTR